MRLLLSLALPLLVQVFGFLAVFVASQGGGSFTGLLAMPVAGFAFLALLTAGIVGARGARPIGGVLARNLALAILPPLLLLVVRAVEG